MNKKTSIKQILRKTKCNWQESFQGISPEILRVHRISTHLRQNLELVLTEYDLQAAEFSVLETLRKEPLPYCLSPTELSTAMLFSSGGLTKVLNRLFIRGFITRLDNPNDKRGKLVQLTESGDQQINKVIVKLHSQEQKKMSILSKEEKKQLNGLLEKVIDVWE